jgi:hypothetical protein
MLLRLASCRCLQEEPGVTTISGDELAELIRHLKLKWQSVNEAYVRLPCVLDTPSKKRRKEVGRCRC